MILCHFFGDLAAYVRAWAEQDGCPLPRPERCPTCGRSGALIGWGTYLRYASEGLHTYHLTIQRLKCTACQRTHALLPDILHPYRHYTISLMQHVVWLYLLVGYGVGQIMAALPEHGPARTTVRDWLADFGHGAALYLTQLASQMVAAGLTVVLNPPPDHLRRMRSEEHRQRLAQGYQLWRLAEQWYAWLKSQQPSLRFGLAHLLAFVLHWLQSQGATPRLFRMPP